jgi:FkbM family methyltransferase
MDMQRADVEINPEFFKRRQSIRLSAQNGKDYMVQVISKGGIEAYEKPTLALFCHFVERLGGTVLDIGANTGLFSLLAAAAHPGVKICAFEPLGSVFGMLEENLALNPKLAARIAASCKGFSEQGGQAVFYETINAHGFVPTSSTLERSRADYEGTYREHVVELITLHEWDRIYQGEPITVVKIDVEGHEHAVLQGGRSVIAKHRPLMIVEMLAQSRFDVMKQIIIEQNYVDFGILPDSLLHLEAPVFFDNDAWNHLLCPAEKAPVVLGACRELGLRMRF